MVGGLVFVDVGMYGIWALCRMIESRALWLILFCRNMLIGLRSWIYISLYVGHVFVFGMEGA